MFGRSFQEFAKVADGAYSGSWASRGPSPEFPQNFVELSKGTNGAYISQVSIKDDADSHFWKTVSGLSYGQLDD